MSATTYAEGWRNEGALPVKNEFAIYIGKFAFDYDPDRSKYVGTVNAEISGFVELGPDADYGQDRKLHPEGRMFLLLYSDERNHWGRIREFWDDLTCLERLQYSSSYKEVTSSSGRWNVTSQIRQHIRPRFWYFAFVNCGANIGPSLQYSLQLRNVNQGFQAEFGTDTYGVIPLDATFSVLFSITAVTSCLAMACQRTGPSAAAQLLYFLQFSATCSAIGCGLRLCHHGVFAQSGQGLIQVQLLGTLFACAAKVLFTAFMAKGWSLLLPPADDEREQPVAIFGALFAVISLSVACEVHEQYFHDQSSEIRLYDSWAGEIILVLNLGLLTSACWLMWEAYHCETLPAVRQLSRRVSATAGIYFTALPVMALLALVLEPWVRRKYVERLELFTRWLATMLLLFFLHPSRSEEVVVAAKVRKRQKQTMKQRRRGI